MLDMRKSPGYAEMWKGINKLGHELMEAGQHGDDVEGQITIFKNIIYEVKKLTIQTPWEKLGISRSTWYRDQRRSKLNNSAGNGA